MDLQSCLSREAIAKLIRPLKSPFWSHLDLFSLPNPPEVGCVEWSAEALSPLANGLKIIDFLAQSSFATASIPERKIASP